MARVKPMVVAAQITGQRARHPPLRQEFPQAHGCQSPGANVHTAVILPDRAPATRSAAHSMGGDMLERHTSSVHDSGWSGIVFVSITQGLSSPTVSAFAAPRRSSASDGE